MRMDAQDHRVTPADIAVHPLDTIGVHIGRRQFDCCWQVDDHLPSGRRLPHVVDGLTDLKGVIEFGAGETLGEYWNCHSVPGYRAAPSRTDFAPQTASAKMPSRVERNTTSR